MAAKVIMTPTIRDRLATGLMLLSALAALYAFVGAVGTVLTAGPATQQVEAWCRAEPQMPSSARSSMAFSLSSSSAPTS